MSCTCVRELIGCKFKVHGRNKEEGFDCLGLAIYIFRENGIELPDPFYLSLAESEKVYEQLINTVHYVKVENPTELCIILINVKGNPLHIGVAINSTQFVHCTESTGVVVESINKWQKRIAGVYKVTNN